VKSRCLISRYPQVLPYRESLPQWPTDEPYSVTASKELRLCAYYGLQGGGVQVVPKKSV
jgi:hypothetical protein